MMLITAVVAPSRVVAVKRALGLFGVLGLTRSHTFVEATRGARVEVYRGTRSVVSLAPRVRLEVLSANADTPDLVRVITRAVTGSDLQLWVTRVDHLVRIRTGEVGLDAL
jgi:nitrogen regulatory protein P-II 1